MSIKLYGNVDMKSSELRANLLAIEQEHGDLEVYIYNNILNARLNIDDESVYSLHIKKFDINIIEINDYATI